MISAASVVNFAFLCNESSLISIPWCQLINPFSPGKDRILVVNHQDHQKNNGLRNFSKNRVGTRLDPCAASHLTYYFGRFRWPEWIHSWYFSASHLIMMGVVCNLMGAISNRKLWNSSDVHIFITVWMKYKRQNKYYNTEKLLSQISLATVTIKYSQLLPCGHPR